MSDPVRKALEAFVKWADDNVEHIDACTSSAWIHGVKYEGEAWPLDQAKKALGEK